MHFHVYACLSICIPGLSLLWLPCFEDEAAAARTTAMLAERQKRAEAAAAAAAREREREEALRVEALALGPIAVDPAWEVEVAQLGEELAALRSKVE